jgi:hypothetical protein
LRSLGIAQQKLREQTGGIFVVTSAQLEYLHPARLDDQLFVTASLKSAGRASLTIEQQALLVHSNSQAQEPTPLCTGSIEWVGGWHNHAPRENSEPYPGATFMNSQDMSILSLVMQASWVVQLVMLILVIASIASWATIFRKAQT